LSYPELEVIFPEVIFMVMHEKRATQMACMFLELSGGNLPYIKLLKLMYMADRKSLVERGATITSDVYYSMDQGPVLSKTYDLIILDDRDSPSSTWRQYVSPPCNWDIRLERVCDLDELSIADKEIVASVFSEYGHMGKWPLIDKLHKELPEWKDPNGSRIPITYQDILLASGLDKEDAKEIASLSSLCMEDLEEVRL
jgi:uncharacterized phage-associated protein